MFHLDEVAPVSLGGPRFEQKKPPEPGRQASVYAKPRSQQKRTVITRLSEPVQRRSFARERHDSHVKRYRHWLRDAEKRANETAQAFAKTLFPIKIQYTLRPEEVPSPIIRVEDIRKKVGKYFGVTRVEMLSIRRSRDIVRPRQIAMYLATVYTDRSLPDIGKRFGGRDHSTVFHAREKITQLLDEGDEVILKAVKHISCLLDKQLNQQKSAALHISLKTEGR